jgi:hypothetical protein
VPYSAKPCVRELEFPFPSAGRIAGEADNLTAMFDSLGIPMMPGKLAASIRLLYFVGFRSVHIPRFVTWRKVGEILIWLDLLFLNR